MGGLVFLFFFWILAMFIDLSAFETTVCTVGIFVFLLLTAYDVKKIQAYYVYYGQMPEMAAKLPSSQRCSCTWISSICSCIF